jgi:hypothetical protein
MDTTPPVLPLKANEAAALADLIYQHLEGKPLTAQVRAEFAALLPQLDLQTFAPLSASLTRDPANASTYYIGIDTPSQPMLLHIALASSPSREFPDAIPIGRMRPGGGREIVIEALPLAAGGEKAIQQAISSLLGKSI